MPDNVRYTNFQSHHFCIVNYIMIAATTLDNVIKSQYKNGCNLYLAVILYHINGKI